MGLIFRLSMRNLLRQKRRNLFLGIGIAFGMMILVIANSFSHGLVSVLINDVVSQVYGHINIKENIGNSFYPYNPDRAQLEKIIKETIPKDELVRMNESLGMFGRAIGNGETDNVVIAGASVENTPEERKKFFEDFLTLVEGNFDNYFNKEIEYPVVISKDKAETLKVKVNDTIRVRMSMVTGQVQAAKLTVIAIATSSNSFMNMVMFMDGDRVKKLLGYKPWEAAGYQIVLKNPKEKSKLYADLIYQKLQPEILSIVGKVGNEPVKLYAYQNKQTAKQGLAKQLKLVSGEATTAFNKEGVLLPKGLAEKLQVKVGEEFTYDYQTKYQGNYQEKLKLTGIYEAQNKLNQNLILVNEERAYSFYNKKLPKGKDAKFLATEKLIAPLLANEWRVLPRTKDSEAMRKQMKLEARNKTKQLKVHVGTMYEGASQILQLEGALNLITLIAVLILFFIILVGVINTLRMTIKERTREIGTVRAIGMQKGDVRNMFITETFLLAAFACLAGIFLGVIATSLLSLIEFNTGSALGIILKSRHLFFKINYISLIGNFFLIMLIAVGTAYFPARHAAKLSAVEALRHYE